MSLSLDDIKNFLVIRETLNITRASEILGMSQPALSYSVKRLEREFGAELIIRLKNGVQLTKTGEEFYTRGKRLILLWEDSQRILTDDDNQEVMGEFSIGIHPSVAIYSLDKLLPEVLNCFPKLNFGLIHGLSREVTQKVINWELDFAIAINPIQHPDLVIKELGKDEVTLFEIKTHRRKLIFDPDLAQSLFILKKLNKSKLDFEGHIHSSNLEVVAKLASEGMGYGLLPSRVAQNYPQLKIVKGAPVFKDTICLVYRKERHANPISKKIIELIKKTPI